MEDGTEMGDGQVIFERFAGPRADRCADFGP